MGYSQPAAASQAQAIEIDREVLSVLSERVNDRRDKWYTTEKQSLPPIESLRETTIIGAFSYCLMSSRERMIKKPDCIPVTEILETPSAIARDYLMLDYKRGPRARSTQIDCIKEGLRPLPNFAKPCHFEHGYYVDVRAAYWSIMLVVGWNVDYWPEKWLSRGRAPERFPYPDHKIARNCLVSAGLSDKVPIYKPSEKEFTELHRGNPLANLSLMRLISDVLQAIAATAVEMGVSYVNTDGYICPNDVCLSNVMNLVREWGLVPSVKYSGSGGVFSSGAYKVGRHRSGLTKYRQMESPIIGIFPPRYSAWLQRSFTFWAAKSNLTKFVN
jgi:hypothetical protein